MPNQRRPGQTFVGVQLSQELLDNLDEGRRKVGQDRSRFIREAVVDKLRSLGYKIDAAVAAPPDRATGPRPKGRPRKSEHRRHLPIYHLNETNGLSSDVQECRTKDGN